MLNPIANGSRPRGRAELNGVAKEAGVDQGLDCWVSQEVFVVGGNKNLKHSFLFCRSRSHR